jgi:hypothetical protein
MKKLKSILVQFFNELLGHGVGWVSGLLSVQLISNFFEERSISNLWGFWSDKWVVDHDTFTNLEWVIAAFGGYVIMKLVDKYWTPLLSKILKINQEDSSTENANLDKEDSNPKKETQEKAVLTE